MSAKWNLIVDVALCSGCQNCFMVAKDEYVGNAEPGYFAAQPEAGHAWIRVEPVERGTAPVTQVTYVPQMCQHCDDAPCMKAAKNGAVRKRPDGIVIIDPDRAKGQRQIVDACPYGAVWWNEAAQLPQAWPFDAHLIDRGWTRPRCVQACTTGALTAAKVADEDMCARAARDGMAPLRPELGTRPRVWYRNLARLTTTVVAGTLEHDAAGRRECAPGVRIALVQAGAVLAEVRSDEFGDFRVECPIADGSQLEVVIETAGGAVQRHAVEARGIVNLGTIHLR